MVWSQGQLSSWEACHSHGAVYLLAAPCHVIDHSLLDCVFLFSSLLLSGVLQGLPLSSPSSASAVCAPRLCVCPASHPFFFSGQEGMCCLVLRAALLWCIIGTSQCVADQGLSMCSKYAMVYRATVLPALSSGSIQPSCQGKNTPSRFTPLHESTAMKLLEDR